MERQTNNQQGIVIVFSLLVLIIITSISFAVLGIFLPKARIASAPLNSSMAIFTADSATEWCLYNKGLSTLRLAMSFDDGAGLTAADSSGYNNNGALVGGPAWVAGRNSGGLDFDGCSGCGQDDVVDAGSGSSLDDLKKGTISFWMYPRSYGENSGSAGAFIINKSDTYHNLGWAVYFEAGPKIKFEWDDGAGDWERMSNNIIPYNAWTHITITFDRGTTSPHPATNIRIYENGVEVPYINPRDGVNLFSDASRKLCIGNEGCSSAAFGESRTFDGIIDDVRVYSRILTQAEIVNDMNTPVSSTPPPTFKQPPASLVMGNGATYNIYYPASGNTASLCDEDVIDHRIVGLYKGVARSLEIHP